MTERSPADLSAYLDPSILENLDAEDTQSLMRLYRELLSAVYVVVKNALVFEMNNPALHKACERAAVVTNVVREHVDDTASIAFLADGVYVNRTLVKVGGGSFEQGEYLYTVFKELGVGEIDSLAETSLDDWMEFAEHFKHSVSHGENLVDVKLSNLALLSVDQVTHGETVAVTERFAALRAYSLSYLALVQLLERMDREARLRVVEIKRPLQQLITAFSKSPAVVFSLIHLKRHKVDVAHHLANTAVLAVAVGESLGLERAQLSELALQAALHDIGRAFVDDDADESECALESVRRWIPLANVREKNLARLVVANEARVWVDDPGEYPWPVWQASRLTAVAHAYDLLTTPRKNRPALLPDEAVRVLIAESGRRYDETAVKLLVNELGVYPIGSAVSLSDGRVALVVEAPRNGGAPTSPRVKVVRDAGGDEVVDGELIDLASAGSARLSVVRCVDPEELEINSPAFLLG